MKYFQKSKEQLDTRTTITTKKKNDNENIFRRIIDFVLAFSLT